MTSIWGEPTQRRIDTPHGFWDCPVCDDKIPNVFISNYNGREYEREDDRFVDEHRKLHAKYGLVIS